MTEREMPSAIGSIAMAEGSRVGGSMAPLVLALPAAVLTAVAAFADQRTGLIPNTLTLGGLAGALVLHGALAAHEGGAAAIAPAVGIAIAGALASGLVPLFLFRRGGLGGGDVKLFVAVGALLGPTLGLRAELLGFVCAALLALAQLARRGELVATFCRLVTRRGRFADGALSLRLGPAICFGTLWATFSSGS